MDSTWKVIRGNAGGDDTISLQSVKKPENHLRHANWLGFVNSGQDEFYKLESSFKVINNDETI